MSANLNRPADSSEANAKLTEEQIASLSFEEALQRIDSIVRSLESGRFPLADSLVQYENGMLLLQHCRRELGLVRQRFEALKGITADGSVQVEPIDPAEFKSDTTSAGRGSTRVAQGRRSKPRPEERGGDSLFGE